MAVYIQHQHEDKSFAVFVGGDDDINGDYDRLYTYDEKVKISEARKEALAYGHKLSERFGTLFRWGGA